MTGENLRAIIKMFNEIEQKGGRAMSFDYSKLSGLIVQRCDTRANFAKAIGLSERTVSLKMTGKIQWKQNEICKACQVLEIPEQDIPSYFFNVKVQVN